MPTSRDPGIRTTYLPGKEILAVTLGPLPFLATFTTWTITSPLGFTSTFLASSKYRKALRPSPRLTKAAFMPGRMLSTLALYISPALCLSHILSAKSSTRCPPSMMATRASSGSMTFAMILLSSPFKSTTPPTKSQKRDYLMAVPSSKLCPYDPYVPPGGDHSFTRKKLDKHGRTCLVRLKHDYVKAFSRRRRTNPFNARTKDTSRSLRHFIDLKAQQILGPIAGFAQGSAISSTCPFYPKTLGKIIV